MKKASLLLIMTLFLSPFILSKSSQKAQLNSQNIEAVLHTTFGDIVIRFFPKEAPNHVSYFLKLANNGFYNGTTFFRVIQYGIIQGGDPFTKNPSKKSLYGTGGLRRLKAEFNVHPCKRGAVAAVLIPGDPNSAGSQFFICVTDQPQLNKKYTVFGEVVQGMHIVEEISQIQTDKNQLALKRVEIKNIEIRPRPQPAFRNATIDELKKWKAIIETELGSITVKFFPEDAPKHVRRFLSFANAGLYNGTQFHRVVPGFVIQGGSMYYRIPPLNNEYQHWLTPLKAEFNSHKHIKGTISMARGKDPDSAIDSFFICLSSQRVLDHQYTVFGTVTSGLDVVCKIANVPRDKNDCPIKPIVIKKIVLKREVKQK